MQLPNAKLAEQLTQSLSESGSVQEALSSLGPSTHISEHKVHEFEIELERLQVGCSTHSYLKLWIGWIEHYAIVSITISQVLLKIPCSGWRSWMNTCRCLYCWCVKDLMIGGALISVKLLNYLINQYVLYSKSYNAYLYYQMIILLNSKTSH